MDKFYLTTPLYYPNARPHVGSAYTTIVCDVIARYKRMCGDEVAYLTGTDEHGEKLQRAAEAAGMQPADFVAEKRKLFIELWKKLGIDYSHFVYTDQPEHVTSVQRLIRLAQKNQPGVIYKAQYQGRYCVHDERYVSDGTDPANCDICGRPAELISEENWFFDLRRYEEPLLKLYSRHIDDPSNYPIPFVQPEYRLNEVVSFVRSGLRPISISRRRLKWGIPWPDDPEQVVYVWYDALTGYMTGIGYAEGEQGSAEFQKLWPADLHMIGKDILRFHAIYWPAFLMAAGLPLPKTVFAHGWIYYEQDKMSKSKGNVVYPEPIVDALESFGAPGNDALRYYLLRDTPFGQDANFSYEGLIERYNSDLANDLGNLANRTVTMLHKYLNHRIQVEAPPPGRDSLHNPREGVRQEAESARADFLRHLSEFRPSLGLEAIFRLASSLNRFLNEFPIWRFVKATGNEYTIWANLLTVARALRFIAVLLYPVIPESAERLWKQLGCEGEVEAQEIEKLQWEWPRDDTQVPDPKPIFPRLDKFDALAKLHELAEADRKRNQVSIEKEKTTVETPSEERPATSEQAEAQPVATPELQSSTGFQPVKEDTARMAVPQTASQISIEDFAKVEMRVGEIISAEPIPKATKLLKLQVDIGTEVRQVCAGIAEYYQPEQLVGMKVVLVTNLQPRKLRGVESNGMIVAASVGDEGRPVLATFKEDVPKGARLK